MSALDLAIAIIKRWEGCKLTAYPDPATGGDPWTIGYGATGPGIGPGVQWTLEQAEERLERDVDRFLGGVKERLERYANPSQLAAMTSLAYNIGLGAFGGSTLLRKFNAGDTAGAAEQFDRWVYAAGKRMRGLERRRADERALFERADFSRVRGGMSTTARVVDKGAGDGHPDREER